MLLAGVDQAQGQTRTETGFLNRTVEIGGATYKYQVYVPADYNTTQRWPVILFLHGAGERGTDGLVQTQVGLAPRSAATQSAGRPSPSFRRSPPDSMWTGVPAQAAMLALERTMKDYATDPDRVYLTGLSMGGNGSFYLAYRYPEKFAAVVPICGWVTVFSEEWKTFDVVAPGDEATAFDRLAQKLTKTAVWIFHGEEDGVVPPEQSRKAAAAIMAVNPVAKFSEVPGVGHNAWDNAFNSTGLSTWLFAQKRQH